MKHMVVRYKVKPEALAEHRRLVEAVFEDLQSRGPEGVRYTALELSDGTFVHLKVDLVEEIFELGELPAFQAFRSGIGERVEKPPQSSEARVVGSYGLAIGG